MHKNIVRIPPLNALRAFSVVADCRNLQKAADSLGVTPQAVGQQIKLLETWLQAPLLQRRGRALELTEAGILLSHFVKSGLEEIADGVRRVSRGHERDRINLNASPFFAMHYLLPRLTLLREVLPQAEIRLTTIIDLPDFTRDEVDLAVQWGYGAWPGLEAKLLIPDPKVICCTPHMAAGISTPADLANVTLLEAFKSKRLWPDIFRHLNIDLPSRVVTMGFDDAATMRRATLQGIGVGLVSEIDADEDIGAGRLVAPFGRHALSDMPKEEIPGFYLVAPRASLRVMSIARLYRWLEAQDWKRHAQPLPPDALAI